MAIMVRWRARKVRRKPGVSEDGVACSDMDTEWSILLGSRIKSTKCDETSPRLMGTGERNARLYQNRHAAGKKIHAAAHAFEPAGRRCIARQTAPRSAKIKIERPCYFVYSVSSRGLTAR
ncbi:hypothetical protein [Ralstonia pickettii]|uniref:hypothetical protein n=1 Tax=Ralstonia pickettii TaxID=329 RepID=UPI001586A1ED|nr:hypothetical protein [Ralstonia pickettii]